MANRQAKNGALVALSCLAAALIAPQAGWCQGATLSIDKANNTVQLEGVTSDQLKQVIGDAAHSGEINVSDANELIAKLNDVDTLMQQFDFIQEQERRMISSVGSSFH